MTLLLEVVATAVGFVTVMLVVSLVVSLLVRVVHYLAGTRAQTLAEMLGALHLGFRLEYGDPSQPGDDAENAFVIAVLSDPALHTSKRMTAAVALRGANQLPQTQDALIGAVEYISKEDLIAIVAKHAVANELPVQWTAGGIPAARSFTNFKTYVERWFRTAEGVSSEQFRRESTRLVVVFSALTVVLLNLDGIQLIQTIRSDAALRSWLGLHAADVLDAAHRFDPAHVGWDVPPIDRNDWLNVDLSWEQVNALVSDRSLGLGWQRSWIVKLWCSYSTECSRVNRPGQATISGFRLLMGMLMWLAGLAFSWGMLSLGAPFWADRLSDLLKLRDAVEQYLGKGPPRQGSRAQAPGPANQA